MRDLRRLARDTRPEGFDPETWRAGRAWSRAYVAKCRRAGVRCYDLHTLAHVAPTLASLYRRIAPAMRAEYARLDTRLTPADTFGPTHGA